MGKPARFPESNFVWQGWPADDTRDQVEDLPAYRDEPAGVTISCWRMSWRERLRILLAGRVWLQLWGSHPPVHIGGENPFERGE